MNYIQVYAGTVVAVAGAGTDWTNATNAAGVPDDTYATNTVQSVDPDSDILRATNFDFGAIPDDAVINGLEAILEAKTSDDTVLAKNATLVLAGAAIGDTDTTTPTIPTTEAEVVFGADSMLWGYPIDRTVLEVSTFGFQLIARISIGISAVVSVDAMSMGVYWEQPAAAPIHRRKVHKFIPPSQRGLRGGL